MIRKLSGHSLTTADCFEAERVNLVRSERGSTCTLTLGPDAPVISVGDWIHNDLYHRYLRPL